MAISGFLKQSTAVTVKIGPFQDSTDGNSDEGGLTITQADVRLSKNGGDMAQKNDATSCTHDEIGIYDCPLSTTDTNTLGILALFVHETGALSVRHDYMILSANVWDSLFGADKLQVDAVEWAGVATATDDLALKATLAKGTDITGFNDLSAAQVNAEVDTALSDYDPPTFTELDTRTDAIDTVINAIKVKTDTLPNTVQKNTALNNFEFLMVDSTDHLTPETGLTITAQRSIDGGAFGATTNSATEVSNGIYKINLSAADLNGDVITFRFSAAGAADRFITILTEP